MKFFVASDLHGNLDFYESSLKHARDEKCQIAVFAGDLFPDGYSMSLSIDAQKDFIDEGLTYYLKEFSKAEIQVVLILGNQDWAYCEKQIKELEEKELCIYANKKLIDVVGTEFQILGYNCVPQSDFYRKDWERLENRSTRVVPSEDFFTKPGIYKIYTIDSSTWFTSKSTIEDDLMTLPRPNNWRKTIVITHVPPKQTPLDRNYAGDSMGSASVRSFILSKQPLVTIHGHIHESPKVTGIYVCPMGSTWSINAGQQTGVPDFHACTFNIKDIPGTIKHTIFGGFKEVDDDELYKTGAVPWNFPRLR